MSTSWLSDEVWTHLFRYLSLADRHTVRLTCKYLRDLVENSNLWKNTTFGLWNIMRNSDEFEEHLWHILPRWRVSSALVLSPFTWKHVTEELPGLTTLIINKREVPGLLDFRTFTELECLYLRNVPFPIDLEQMTMFMPQSLTHLSICQLMFDSNDLPAQIPENSVMKNLKTLNIHCVYDLHPVNVLHFLLSSLPQLQHLSLSAYTETPYVGNISDLPPLNNCSLSSLELTRVMPQFFPMDLVKIFRALPFLRSLAIDYNGGLEDEFLKLANWLKALPALTSLLVDGREASEFVDSVPSGLTHLIIKPWKMTFLDMTALSTKVPNLCYLHLEEKRSFLGKHIGFISTYFPRLKTLCINFMDRHTDETVPDEAFLSLSFLNELEVLEILDKKLPPAALVSKFHELSNNRVRIYCRPGENELKSCTCPSNPLAALLRETRRVRSRKET